MTDPRELELSHVATALDAQYVVERELGRGGMGVVYLARDRMLDRLVALKTLPAHLAGDERIRERFVREARTAASLSHPHIVPIHRADEINGVVFFVMGYVDGQSLAERIRDQGPLSPVEAAGYLRDVAAALDAAHGRGVIHRDVKAENILIDAATGRALVTDFGIARVAEAAPMTATGLILGSVHYMSPEHASGEPVDARSDVYSLGVVAFFTLSGRFPFENDAASAVVIAHVTRPAPKLHEIAPGVPRSIAAVVDRCLEKEPTARFQSCREFIKALEHALRDRAQSDRADVMRAAVPPGTTHQRLSDSEAREVFDRAAQMQEGLVAPPTERASRSTELAPNESYDAAIVRESAREAGIATRFIDRALAERSPAPSDVAIVADNSPATSPWSGAPPTFQFEAVVDGEVPERDFDRLVETIRRTLGDVGLVTTVGRSFAWASTDQNRKVNASVAIRDGQTTIRVTERLAPLAGAVYGGGIGGFGGGFGGAAFGILMGATNGDAMVVVPAALSVVVSAVAGSRFVFVRTARKRRHALHILTEKLAEEARVVIARRSAPRRLDAGSRSDERERVR